MTIGLSGAVTEMQPVIIVAPIAVLTDVFAFANYKLSDASKPDLAWLLPSLLVGIALGYFFFVLIDPDLVSLGIGLIAFVFAVDWFVRMRSKPERVERPISPPLAVISGGIFGFTSFVAHAGGPIVSAFL